MKPKFIRTDSFRLPRLGKNRKNKQVWRRARGVHSKVRRMRKSYPVMPTVGYKTQRKNLGKVQGLKPILVHNLNELAKATKENIIIIASVGARKKLDIIKKADEMKIKIANLGGTKKWN